MSFFRAMNISSSGLAAQRMRMNILSSNLANAQSTQGGPDGGPFRRQDVVYEAKPYFDDFRAMLDEASGAKLRKVNVKNIHQDQNPPKQVYNPSHPDANDEGYVSMPNIEVMTEMVNMIAASRAYEANASALDGAKQMALKAIEIGR